MLRVYQERLLSAISILLVRAERRKAQNRASQRAYRARKDKPIRDLMVQVAHLEAELFRQRVFYVTWRESSSRNEPNASPMGHQAGTVNA